MEIAMKLVKKASVFSKLVNENSGNKKESSKNKNKERLTNQEIKVIGKELFEDYMGYLLGLKKAGTAGILSTSNEAVMELFGVCLRRSFGKNPMTSARFESLEKYTKVCVNRFKFILNKYKIDEGSVERIIRVAQIHMEVVDRKVAQMEAGLWK